MTAPEHIEWKQSSACSGGTCVQVAYVNAEVWVRDSKRPAAGPLRFTAAEWDAFMKGVTAGEFRF